MKYEKNRRLSEFCSLRIGGPAKLFCVVRTADEMQRVMRDGASERLLFLGRGSNILFHDEGFDGLVVLVKIDYFRQSGGSVDVGAGASFSRIGGRTARDGWGGLEFACGIPGSVGGAIVMNAGASGGEVADVLEWVDVVTQEGKCHRMNRADLRFAYRASPFQGRGQAVVGAGFRLFESPSARAVQIELIDQRKAAQPLSEHSAGCIFRNPPGLSAGALVEQCGLKGARVGGAVISGRHANFIVNAGGATARDVLELKEMAKSQVRASCGVELTEEICCIHKEGEIVSR